MTLPIRKVCFLFLFSVMISSTWSQPKQMHSGELSGLMMSFEPHYKLNQNNQHTLDILYRLRYDYFVFIRSFGNGKEVFKAHGELQIEILDSSSTAVKRQFRTFDLNIPDNTSSSLRTQYVQGVVSFTLPSGKYSAIYNLSDKESERNMPNGKDIITIPHYSQSKSLISDPILFKEEHPVFPAEVYNLGGDVNFSTNIGIAFLTKQSLVNDSLKISLNQIITGEDEKKNLIKDSLIAVKQINKSTIEYSKNDTSPILIKTIFGNSNLVYFVLQSKKLKQGKYELHVKTNTDSISQIIFFNSKWLDMPMSLTDLDLAVEMLQYIASKDEYSEINSGRRSAIVEKFYMFWQKKDPTPETAYNEIMAEYYKRVDYTIGTFRTIDKLNGALTDRGKIYILYGKPTSTERILGGNNIPKEIWQYTTLKKTFVFEDSSKKGNYKLIAQE